MLKKILLGCGIASSVLYVAIDVVGSLRYEAYSYWDQSFSELLADDSAVRGFMVGLLALPYAVLVTAFGIGVWSAAGPRRNARITGGLLVAYAVVGFAGGVLFRTETREVLAAGEGDARAGLHVAATLAQSVFLLAAMGFGATLLGRRFRRYTYATILVLLVFGGLVGTRAGDVEANNPTPWLGLIERVNIYATMLWIAVLAIALLRTQGAIAAGQPSPDIATARS